MVQKLMTEREKEIAKRNSNVRAAFEQMRAEFPDASDWRIYGVLSGRFKVTTMTIRNIIKR